MAHRVEVTTKPGFKDPLGEATKKRIHNELGISTIDSVRTAIVYMIDSDMPAERLNSLGRELFADPIVEDFSVDRPVIDGGDEGWTIQVGYKPGVKDGVGEVSSDSIAMLTKGERHTVYTSRIFRLKGSIGEQEVSRIAKDLLANELVEDFSISQGALDGKYLPVPKVALGHKPTVRYIDLNVSDESLLEISRNRYLALNLDEMRAIKEYFGKEAFIAERKKRGMSAMPTDTELEVIAQTWSEHCKHKIFSGDIEYTDENGSTREIHSLFKTYIKRQATELKKKLPWIVSILWDNSGVIKFDKDWLLCMKCETHNSPSNKDPYGGSITGIVGVYRDPMGTGKGGKIVWGNFGFCTGDPDYKGSLRPVLHPSRLLSGVVKGVEDGGNKHGVPTNQGLTRHHEGYIAKPIVFVKADGIIPKEVLGQPGHEKSVNPGDLIVMCGGLVGIDGIHGATESSLEAGKHISTGHVQMGDPYTQKKMHDFLIEARDAGLYRFITDNGAGGLSSSVGESGTFSNGFRMNLAKVPLKYAGLDPWQIIVSESQERMTLAVPPEKMEAFKRLARKHDVESNVIGEFTNDGKFDVVYGEKQVAYMDMSFVHENVPQKSLSAKWSTPEQRGLREPELPGIENYGSFLKNMLARPNIASIEYIFRQYDHEVQGGSVIKPFVGRDSDASSDASVSRPLLKSNRGVALADGLAAEYNQIDPYHGTLCALDETIRRVVAVGANPKKIALNDNFCWPSPLPSKNNPDADYKTAQLVRANEALYEGTTKLKVPCVSGKDSMSMDGTVMDADGKERRISALPTLKFAADGIVTDVRKCVTMDAKCPGDLVYMLGMTRDELGGSEFYSMHSEVGLNVPKVDLKKSRLLYNVVYSAMNRGIIASCHGCYKGGLGIALAQTAFAGGYGMDVSLSAVPKEGLDNDAKLLFSESAGRFVVTVPQDKQEQFEKVMRGRRKTGSAVDYGVVGKVTNNSYLKVTGLGGNAIINESIGDLKQAWKGTYANR